MRIEQVFGGRGKARDTRKRSVRVPGAARTRTRPSRAVIVDSFEPSETSSSQMPAEYAWLLPLVRMLPEELVRQRVAAQFSPTEAADELFINKLIFDIL